MMCLEKDPAKRPSSALQLDSQLARVPCEPMDERAGTAVVGGPRARSRRSLEARHFRCSNR